MAARPGDGGAAGRGGGGVAKRARYICEWRVGMGGALHHCHIIEGCDCFELGGFQHAAREARSAIPSSAVRARPIHSSLALLTLTLNCGAASTLLTRHSTPVFWNATAHLCY